MTPAPYTELGNRWTFGPRGNRTILRTVPLVLIPEVSGAPLSDDYSPDEINARDMFRLWVKDTQRQQERKRAERYDDDGLSAADDAVPITWFVCSPEHRGLFEFADRCPYWGHIRSFSDFWTTPLQAVTGDEIDWLRVPVFTGRWAMLRPGENLHTAAPKGCYINEATGWTPEPYQASVSLRFLAERAGVALSGAR